MSWSYYFKFSPSIHFCCLKIEGMSQGWQSVTKKPSKVGLKRPALSISMTSNFDQALSAWSASSKLIWSAFLKCNRGHNQKTLKIAKKCHILPPESHIP